MSIRCCTQVDQSEVAIIETCGYYSRNGQPGCNCLIPCVDVVAGKVSLRLQENRCRIESKTKDNVFVFVSITYNYQILPDSIERAFYELSNPIRQIESYVFNSIRGKIPQYTLDELFQERATLSEKLKEEVDDAMTRYGFEISMALISNIEPADSVRKAINLIETSKRLRNAALDAAEAEKIRTVKFAEAEAEAKRLSGVGLAEQRMAIMAGLRESLEDFQDGVPVMRNDEIMSLLLLNQYFDTLREVAVASKKSTLMLPHSGGLDDVANQIMHGVLKSSTTEKE